jgi:uncharacterized protein (TIGR02117 family)
MPVAAGTGVRASSKGGWGTAAWLYLMMLVSPGCMGPVVGVFPAAKGDHGETVYVVNHGWHTGLVVPTARLPVSAWRPREGGMHGKYLEFGWGDDDFYRASKVNSGMALRAMCWRNPAVLHVVAMDESPEVYFPNSGIIKITVSGRGFERLCEYLAKSYASGADGSPIDLGKGIYGNSRFYRASDHYYFPNTCNKWTARALRAAGAPITPFYAVRAANVFNQSRKFGEVVRELSAGH